MREILERPGRLAVRAGVNRGRVFAGDFGPPYRRTYSIKGDAVNLAARLMARALPGQLLAAEAVVRASRSAFELDALEPFLVKGKANPVQAYAVGSRAGEAARETAGTPFVGRTKELSLLARAVDEAET